MKKILSFILCGFIILSIAATCCVSVSADDNMYLEYDSDILGWTITGCDYDIVTAVIPAYYEGYPIVKIAANAFSDRSYLTSVTIPNTVTEIGEMAFYNCMSLSSLTLDSGLKTIGDSAFFNCDGLKVVTLPQGLESIGNSAFSGCDSIESVTIPESVTSIGDAAFYSCDKLPGVIIPDSVTYLGSEAFYSCDGLKSVSIGKSITEIKNSTFEKCAGLTSIVIPDSVKSIGDYAFSTCIALTNVTIPNSVTSIGSAVFELAPYCKIRCNEGSYAESWAIANGVATEPLTAGCVDHQFGEPLMLSTATCETAGNQIIFCTLCGYSETTEIPATGHRFGSSTTITEPSEYSSGTAAVTCVICNSTMEYALDCENISYEIQGNEQISGTTPYLIGISFKQIFDYDSYYCPAPDNTDIPSLTDYINGMTEKSFMVENLFYQNNEIDYGITKYEISIKLPEGYSDNIRVFHVYTPEFDGVGELSDFTLEYGRITLPTYDYYNFIICDMDAVPEVSEDSSTEVSDGGNADGDYSYDYDYSWDGDYSYDYSWDGDYSYDYSLDDYLDDYDVDTAVPDVEDGNGAIGWWIGGGIVGVLLLVGSAALFGLIFLIIIIAVIVKIVKSSKKKKAAKAAEEAEGKVAEEAAEEAAQESPAEDIKTE